MFDTLTELAAEWILPTVFFWFVLCIMATSVQDWIAARLALRAHYLADAIEGMLGDQELVRDFYQSPLIQTRFYRTAKRTDPVRLKKPGFSTKHELGPDHIDPKLFAKVILNWVTEAQGEEPRKQTFVTASEIHDNLRKMRDSHPRLAETLEILLSEFREKNMSYHEVFTGLQTSIEMWFKAAMEETTRAYRRQAQVSLLSVGLIISVLVNFDPIFLTTQLWDSSPEEEAASTLPVGWRLRPLVEPQDSGCRLGPGPGEEFGIPLSLYRACANPASPTGNTNVFYKIAGFIVGALLIRIGSGYVHDLWKEKVSE